MEYTKLISELESLRAERKNLIEKLDRDPSHSLENDLIIVIDRICTLKEIILLHDDYDDYEVNVD